MSTKKIDDLIIPSKKDIWRYAKLLDPAGEGSQIAIQKDWTPVEKVGELLVKREDKSVTGSHKFRSLEYQISRLKAAGTRQAVLSSSGNAAISASQILSEYPDLKLFVFLSKKTAAGKLAAIRLSPNLIPILSSRPLRLAKYAVKHFHLPDLRPSQDVNARIGFRSLGFEIFEQNPKVENIFSFATSFASVRGITDAYAVLKDLGAVKKIPKLYAVTSSGKFAGSLSLSRKGGMDKNSLSSRQAVDTSLSRLGRVDISDEEILSTRQKYPELETSDEGIASLAAAEKVKPVGETLVILTGSAREDGKTNLDKFLEAESFSEVDEIILPAS